VYRSDSDRDLGGFDKLQMRGDVMVMVDAWLMVEANG